MKRAERALELFRSDFNCSQAVFAAYRQEETLDEASALKLATVFGAGLSGTGAELCGAASGALLAISQREGMGDRTALPAKARTYELGQYFLAEFRERMGSCRCEEILGVNLGSPAAMAAARAERLFETRCPKAIQTAAAILEEIL